MICLNYTFMPIIYCWLVMLYKLLQKNVLGLGWHSIVWGFLWPLLGLHILIYIVLIIFVILVWLIQVTPKLGLAHEISLVDSLILVLNLMIYILQWILIGRKTVVFPTLFEPLHSRVIDWYNVIGNRAITRGSNRKPKIMKGTIICFNKLFFESYTSTLFLELTMRKS